MTGTVPYMDLLMEMLSIPAVSRQEKERADFLEGNLSNLGFAVTRIHNNLLVGDTSAQPGRPRILLNSHMDTVAPGEGWKSDPFTPVLDKTRITGLGSNDAGASLVTMITAYQLLKDELKNQMNLILLISAEEEVSGRNGISSVLEQLGPVDGVIVGEPTGMRPAVAERGLMVLDGEAKGQAGHAARDEGDNAIYGAIKDILSIAGLAFPIHSQWLPGPGAQVTMISAGKNHNVVPDICRFVVDVRSNDQYDNETLLEMIRSVCSSTLTPRSTRLKPSALDQGHFLMRAIHHAGLEPFGSSTLSDMALIPAPAVKMGPGDSSRSHTTDEFILTSELEQGVEGFCNFLKSLSTVLNHEYK